MTLLKTTLKYLAATELLRKCLFKTEVNITSLLLKLSITLSKIKNNNITYLNNNVSMGAKQR